jgi:hypothetical protein
MNSGQCALLAAVSKQPLCRSDHCVWMCITASFGLVGMWLQNYQRTKQCMAVSFKVSGYAQSDMGNTGLRGATSLPLFFGEYHACRQGSVRFPPPRHHGRLAKAQSGETAPTAACPLQRGLVKPVLPGLEIRKDSTVSIHSVQKFGSKFCLLTVENTPLLAIVTSAFLAGCHQHPACGLAMATVQDHPGKFVPSVPLWNLCSL